jgi:hypothetical protein
MRLTPGALSVPITALVATGGNTRAVRVAGSGGPLLPVKLGTTVGGYVEVSGPGIHEGLVVENPAARSSG